jgi:uncharacterized protein (TIGR02271 family)
MKFDQWRGEEVIDRDGDKIGTIADVYYDEDTREAEWARVRTGLFGMRETFIPIGAAEDAGDVIRVQFEKGFVKDAPNVESEGELTQAEEARLAEYYGLSYTEQRSSTGLPEGKTRDAKRSRGDDAMTRSEEELRVGKARRPSQLVRLKKHIVTEPKQVTVPVQREEVRVEREPITDANRADAMSGPALRESEHEVTLQEEEVTVDKKVVPKERVRLNKDVSTEHQEVQEEVRKEQIDVERERRR